MQEIQHYDLPTQTNIYSSCTFIHKNRVKLLVAAGKDVYCTYSTDTIDGNVRWHQTPMTLPNITQDNEIVSIACFDDTDTISHKPEDARADPNRSFLTMFTQTSNPILAVTTVKTDKKSDDSDILGYIHFFGATNSSVYKLDDISAIFSNVEAAQAIDLNFLPFKVSSVKFHGKKGKAFVLAGSDRFHIYVQDPTSLRFIENNIVDYIPGLPKLPSSILSFDIKYFNTKTFVAIGCQDGYVHLLTPGSEIESQGFYSDGPISSLALFTDTVGSHFNNNLHPAFGLLNRNVEQHNPLAIFSNKEYIHLIAADAIGTAIYFRHVNQQGLKDRSVLPESDKHDSIVAVLIADIDFDGKNEVVLGTYSQQVLVYKDREGLTTVPSLKKNEYYLHSQYTFNKPIMSLHWADLSQDGVDNLVVVTAIGIHILQCNMQGVVEKTLKYLNALKEVKQLESDLEVQIKRQEELAAKLKPGRRAKNPFRADSWNQLLENKETES